MLAAVGIFALVWAVNGLLAKDPGWTQIEADNSGEPSCAGEFTLQYNVGADGSQPAEQFKKLTALYTDVSIQAEKLFSAAVDDEKTHGIGFLNRNVNRQVTVEPEVYNALLLLQKAKSREIFLAPVYEQYNTLFFCATDEEAESVDPSVTEEQREIIAEMIAYVSDPEQIDIMLEEGNRVTLRLSDDYIAYARRNGIERFVDLYWMKNAFAADYMADRIFEAGFTDGYLTCGEGFTRSLGGKDILLSSTVYDRVGKSIYKAASLKCGTVKSVVVFHDYPAGKNNDKYYYQYSEGRMVTPYIAVSDGLCRASVSNLTVCSESKGCAETMLAANNAYFSHEFPAEKLLKKLGETYCFAYPRDNTIWVSSSRLTVKHLLNDGVVSYSAKVMEAKSDES